MLLNAFLQKTPHIPPLTRGRMLRRLGFSLSGNEVIQNKDKLVLILANYLMKAGVAPTEQISAGIEWAWDEIQEAGTVLSNVDFKFLTEVVPSYRVAIMDRRYITFTGMSSYCDTMLGEDILKLPRAPIETITYNATALYLLAVSKLEKE